MCVYVCVFFPLLGGSWESGGWEGRHCEPWTLNPKPKYITHEDKQVQRWNGCCKTYTIAMHTHSYPTPHPQDAWQTSCFCASIAAMPPLGGHQNMNVSIHWHVYLNLIFFSKDHRHINTKDKSILARTDIIYRKYIYS